ncbi:unnamed protein product [Bursaphelenchus xylophilus]|uniref:(pine wood nematode) hypothetical protein n=1 Tax=Bursaphelenchus xylophilus TaxID=6326 RepID=A0A1I7RMY3_BURXY|nr:unnamed protein product [Bursaphelenchus xylophilus]CAG9125350.1 unnamed protein product [Bursaphelenchus xylophilus]
MFELLPIVIDLATALFFFSGSIDYVYTGIMMVIACADMNLTNVMDYIDPPFYMRPDYYDRDEEDESEEHNLDISQINEFETVKYFCNEKEELRKFRLNKANDNITCYANYWFSNSIKDMLRNGLMMIGSVLMAYRRPADSEMTVGDYMLFAHYFYRFTSPLNTISEIAQRLRSYFDDMDVIYELFHDRTEIPSENSENVEISGGIRIQNLSFSYSEDNKILKNVSFDVPEGKTVALVGPSGSGKSTIIRLLYRFLDPDQGSIFIGEADLQGLDIYSYRKTVSIVPQDCTLLQATVRKNIGYGRISATDEEIDKAAALAKIDNLLQRDDTIEQRKIQKKKLEKMQSKVRKLFGFPYYEDLDDYAEEEEEMQINRMSGGERQRVAIARALLKDPKYLFLDEATSSLDTITEKQIQHALTDAANGKTCIIVAHRLSTIAHADNIVVLKDGTVVEQGTHNQLLKIQGLYSKMWHLQQGGDLSCVNLD